MSIVPFYGDFDPELQEAESLATIARGLALGINFLDTAWIYQDVRNGKIHANEDLVGKAIKIHGREKFVIATKCGLSFENGLFLVSGKEDLIRKQLSESLARLGTDYIDLYYIHRIDRTMPIEEIVATLKSLVEEEELRRAHAVHPISAVEMEWNLQTRDIENTIVPVARELGVGKQKEHQSYSQGSQSSAYDR
eukprot:gene16595-18882_t